MLFASRSRVVSDLCICSLWHLLFEDREGSAVNDRQSKAWLPMVHIPAHHVPLDLLVTLLLRYIKLGTFRSCMPFYPPPPNNPLVLLPYIRVPIMSLWVAPRFHEDSLALPQLCVPRIHLYMCWHAGGSVQTWWLAKQKWLVIAAPMSVFMEILASFLCPTDFLKPYVKNTPAGLFFCQIWYRLNDMFECWLCRLGCRWAVDVLAYRYNSPQNSYNQDLFSY